MPRATVLRKLPFFETPTTTWVRNDRLAIKPYQIILWVSLAAGEQDQLEPNIPRLPALLDIGLSYNFAIGENQLLRWAGLHPQSLSLLGHARLSGLPVDVRDADVWLHRNQPGQRDLFTDQPPFRLELYRGIAVYPRDTPNAPRLPLLGLRGLRWTNLQLALDCQACRISLRTPRRFWLFG
jgi:hypothetical protein